VATATGLPFLDTGAMYRCVTLAVLRHGIDAADEESVADVARNSEVAVHGSDALLDGEDVSVAIRSDAVNSLVSRVAANSGVRDVLRRAQRAWAMASGGGVVEGRDIGTVVFPDAVLKVFLTASPEERARRRVRETNGDLNATASSMAERDRIDTTRQDSPLKPAEGAVTVDSTGKSIDQVVGEIVQQFRRVDRETRG
jgi:cytidylate kinase